MHTTISAVSSAMPAHNHPYESGFDRKSADCPRCQINAATTGVAIHACKHGGAFGRRDTNCARCCQLVAGENTKTATGYAMERRRRWETSSRAHRCSESNCGPVCTFGNW